VKVGNLCYWQGQGLPRQARRLVILVSRDTTDMGEFTIWQALFEDGVRYQVGQARLELVSEIP